MSDNSNLDDIEEMYDDIEEMYDDIEEMENELDYDDDDDDDDDDDYDDAIEAIINAEHENDQAYYDMMDDIQGEEDDDMINPSYGIINSTGQVGYFYIINGERVQVENALSPPPAPAPVHVPAPAPAPAPAPKHAAVTPCKYGVNCTRSGCWFSHPTPTPASATPAPRQGVCRFWMNGTCRKGDKCEFSHN